MSSYYEWRCGACGSSARFDGYGQEGADRVLRFGAEHRCIPAVDETDPQPVSKATEMWTRPNTSSGEFRALRRRGVSFRGAQP